MLDQVKFDKLAGTRVLILGGSSGIGFAVAEGAIESNVAALIISSSSSSRVKTGISRLKAAYPTRSSTTTTISGYACNLGDASTLESNVVSLLELATEGRTKLLDHVVHTAGDELKLLPLTSDNVTVESAIQAGMVRYYSNIMLAKHLPKYVNPGGQSSFTMTTAVIAEMPNKEWTLYGAMYAALYGLIKGAALENAPLRTNGVNLGVSVSLPPSLLTING
jgi:NAD(P)-dependent dehydrogenase (short-subunit alcohol dehydrogenase family)